MLPGTARLGTAGWVANGFLFAAYLTFQWWLFPPLLGATRCMAYLVCRTGSIWPGLAPHLAVNGLNLGGIVVLMARSTRGSRR